MKPEPKAFSRKNPCKRADLKACFCPDGEFRDVQVDEAHSIIGVYAPRQLIRAKRAFVQRSLQKDCYVLTELGREWLLE